MSNKIWLTVIISFVAMAFLPLCMFAQPRTESEVKSLIKKGKKTSNRNLSDGAYVFNVLSDGKEVSLKENMDILPFNNVERVLLSNYDDVILSSKLPNGYFVIKDNSIGLYALNGKILVPPLPGYPRIMKGGNNTIYFGDLEPISNYIAYIGNGRGKARRAYAGDFSVILDKETLEPLIPLGKFDGIHYTFKGMRTFYYVDKIVNGKKLWGVYNAKGEEIVPCKYSYVGVEKGEFVGNDNLNMEKEMDILKAKLKYRQDKYEARWQRLGCAIINVAKTLGEAIVTADNFMQEYGVYNAINTLASFYGTSNSSFLPTDNTMADRYDDKFSNSATSGNKYDLGEQNNYNTDKRTWGNYDSMLASHFAGNKPATKNDVVKWQQAMKKLRSKWTSKGKSFPQSANENKSTSGCANGSHSH